MYKSSLETLGSIGSCTEPQVYIKILITGSKVSDYNNSIKKLAHFSSIQEFWSVYSHIKRPNELGHVTG